MGRLERQGITSRLTQQLPAKIAVWLGLAVGICLPYFTLQRIQLFSLRTVPELALDRAVVFDPRWIWLYLSVCVMVPLAPGLATKRSELARYAGGLALLCGVCFAAFAGMPVLGPRPALAPDHAVYQWLVGVDRPLNSFPSLHAGLVTYSILFTTRVLRGTPGAPLVAAGAGLWGLLIFYATLATKQHWAVDLPAGALAALAAHVFVWRGAAER